MGKIVVKKIQSQASNTAFQIPSTDGTTGQVMKTDGSANLGWTDKSSKIGSAGIDYTMPPADGTAGKVLQTDGTTGNLEFVTPSANPLSTPDGAHQGLRLCDKYFFGLNDAANANSVTLTIPSSYTTTPSDVLSMEIYMSGSGSNQNGTNDGEFFIYPLAQDGTTTTRKATGNTTMVQGYGSYYKDTGQDLNYGTDGTSGNTAYFKMGHNYMSFNNDGTTTRWDGSRGTSFQAHPVGQLLFKWWNANAYPQAYYMGSMGKTGFYGQDLPGQRIFSKAANYSTSDGFHKTSAANVKHSMGFKIQGFNNATLCDGVFMLFARFKDGVVS